MELLTNPVRDYAWGSTTAIPELLGRAPDGRPQAEMWVGAHPGSPSTTSGGRRLDDVVAADPAGVLGEQVAARFGARLPYLVKVLAAVEPLSIQVHPSEEQARAGHAREQEAGVPADAAHRLYKDEHHKPEMILALTDFEALCGVRDPGLAADALRDLVGAPGCEGLGTLVAVLDGSRGGEPAGVLRRAVALLLEPRGRGTAWARGVTRACGERLAAGSPYPAEDRTVVELAQHHPGDPGVLLALLLHRVHLAPGQALALAAGNVHAYLHGTGIEVMAASDNVLRGGLTGKHVDAGELQRVADLTPVPVPRVEPQDLPSASGTLRRWTPGFAEVELTRAEPAGGRVVLDVRGPRVVLCTDGRVVLQARDARLELGRGATALVRDDDGDLALTGDGEAWVASVPPAPPG